MESVLNNKSVNMISKLSLVILKLKKESFGPQRLSYSHLYTRVKNQTGNRQKLQKGVTSHKKEECKYAVQN